MRAVPRAGREVPAWPDLREVCADRVGGWVDWLRQVWESDDVAEAISHASPALAEQVRALCAGETGGVRPTFRTVLAVARYVQRLGRATPFGLIAGVAAATVGDRTDVAWGQEHQVIAQAAAGWLSDVVARLEGCAPVLARLPVVANSTLVVRGDRLIVPHQPHAPSGRDGAGVRAVEISMRHSHPVATALALARDPIPAGELADALQAAFPAADRTAVTAMITEMVTRRALISSLHAPATVPDALAHLLEHLDTAAAGDVPAVAELVADLRWIHTHLDAHNQAPAAAGRSLRADLTERMQPMTGTGRHPLALDLRLDTRLMLPAVVVAEVERAALILARASSYPSGTPAWKEYHQRFYERFGIGSLVPLLDVVDPDSGIGWPDGYPGTPPLQRPRRCERDDVLLRLAQRAALEGHREIVLDETLLNALDLSPRRRRLPSHLELCVRIDACDRQALDRGDFTVEVLSVSRSAAALRGRFLPVLGAEDRQVAVEALAHLPAADPRTVPAQVSFPSLDPAGAHVARTVQALPLVISLAEHRGRDETVLTVADLGVGCDGRRLYLAAPGRGVRVEAVSAHALNLHTHTPPLGRYLLELTRAQNAQVTGFDWGTAATLPFLPRLRAGRSILAPATWRLPAADLPAPGRPWREWESELTGWRDRRRMPARVLLVEDDRRLPLDLDVSAHQVLLRTHLSTHPEAVLAEAPAPGHAGWFDGHAHEIVVPLHATAAPAWPVLPDPSPARVIGRDQGDTPGTSGVLLAKLYGDLATQDVLLGEHLPVLLARLGDLAPVAAAGGPGWWFLRFRDPDQHLRLRVALPDPDVFGPAAQTVSGWADDLHRRGLLRELHYATSYPETGRWGSGAAMVAAERVFGADSAAVLAQLAHPGRPHRQVLVAAHTVAIAVAFTGSTAAGMGWLIERIPATAPGPLPRPVFQDAVRLADPGQNWAALTAVPGGTVITSAWAERTAALAAYRQHLPGPDTIGVDADDVLSSLLHAHYVRALGIDFDGEASCLYLARAAALAWTARTRTAAGVS